MNSSRFTEEERREQEMIELEHANLLRPIYVNGELSLDAEKYPKIGAAIRPKTISSVKSYKNFQYLNYHFSLANMEKGRYNNSIVVRSNGSVGIICGMYLINSNFPIIEVKLVKTEGRKRTSIGIVSPGFTNFSVLEISGECVFWELEEISFKAIAVVEEKQLKYIALLPHHLESD